LVGNAFDHGVLSACCLYLVLEEGGEGVGHVDCDGCSVVDFLGAISDVDEKDLDCDYVGDECVSGEIERLGRLLLDVVSKESKIMYVYIDGWMHSIPHLMEHGSIPNETLDTYLAYLIILVFVKSSLLHKSMTPSVTPIS